MKALSAAAKGRRRLLPRVVNVPSSRLQSGLGRSPASVIVFAMQDRQEAPDNLQPSYPSFFARTGAFLIDWAVILLLAAFLNLAAAADDTGRLVIFLIVLSLYEIGFHLAIGATPGKMALRMHVAGPDGERPDPDRIILRYLVFFLSMLFIVGIPISAFMVLTDPQRRALHDRVAGTRVHYGRPAWLQNQT